MVNIPFSCVLLIFLACALCWAWEPRRTGKRFGPRKSKVHFAGEQRQKMKPKALDLFCGAGGATMGLMRAGFHVTGVDINPQSRYVGDLFHQADALTFPLEGYDFIWASPPCQAYTIAGMNERNKGKVYADVLAPMRERLSSLGTPWVIENVPGAPMRANLILCGSQFGLTRLVRHRLFEFSFDVFKLMPPCSHGRDIISLCGDGSPSWTRKRRIARGLRPDISVAEKRKAIQCEWMNRRELSQAVPPAYSEFIGKQALEYIRRVA